MKKLLSIILAIAMLCSMATAVFADEVQNYEYILPIEYKQYLQTAKCLCCLRQAGEIRTLQLGRQKTFR